MKEEKSQILKRLGKEPGFKVPEHYFDDFNKKMAESLPEITITDENVKPSMWLRVRPYVYMAAMFAGIWCMMTVFNNFNGESNREQQAHQISAGVQNERNADEVIMQGDVSDYDITTYEDSVAANESRQQPEPSK